MNNFKDAKWEIVTDINDMKDGVYQEKYVVVARDYVESIRLKDEVIRENGELCEMPTNLKAKYDFAFAFWANKQDSVVDISDINAGNIRRKIN